MISVTINADEVILRLDQFPRRLREALRGKFSEIFSEFESSIFSKAPGKFLDPAYIRTGIGDIGNLTIGFIEATDKPGRYYIFPSKARALRFIARDGDIVFAKVVRHPFLKSIPSVEHALSESKPWIVDKLEDAVIEAL